MTVVTKHKPKEKQTSVQSIPRDSAQSRVGSGISWHLWVGGTAVTLILTLRQPVWEMLSLVGDQEAVSTYLKGFGLLGPLVLAIVQLIQILVAVIPGHVFLIAAGYVYGFPFGLLLNVGYIVAASPFSFSPNSPRNSSRSSGSRRASSASMAREMGVQTKDLLPSPSSKPSIKLAT